MSKRLKELQEEEKKLVDEYTALNEQGNEIAHRKNDIGKQLLTLKGKIEAYEEMKK